MAIKHPYRDDALTPEAEAEYENFLLQYREGSCYCLACGNPPCSYCEGSGTHPGHPLSLIEDKHSWEPMMVTAIRLANEGSEVFFEELDISEF